MIVDDDEDALLLARRLVEKAAPNAMVLTINGARDAMAHLVQATNPGDLLTLLPDIMLLDLNMPGMDGFSLLRWVRRNKALAAVKVVMLSSSEAVADIKRATELGAHGYLIKYPNPSCLACLLKQALVGTERSHHAIPHAPGSDGDSSSHASGRG